MSGIPLYLDMEVAVLAILVFLRKRTLHLALAESACYSPAASASIFSAMRSIKPFFYCSWADPHILLVRASGFAAALFSLPAVAFLHHYLPVSMYESAAPFSFMINYNKYRTSRKIL
jgi:hypothetical protein